MGNIYYRAPTNLWSVQFSPPSFYILFDLGISSAPYFWRPLICVLSSEWGTEFNIHSKWHFTFLGIVLLFLHKVTVARTCVVFSKGADCFYLWTGDSSSCMSKSAQIFQKSKNHHKILGMKQVVYRMPTNVRRRYRKVDTWVTCSPGFVHPWYMLLQLIKTLTQQIVFWVPFLYINFNGRLNSAVP